MNQSISSAPGRDRLGRPAGQLRVSVTDRCNLRCQYCMPEAEYIWLQREHLLSFEEIARAVGLFTALGVRKVRLTGGEPLLRRDLHRLVGLLAQNPLIEDLALTTNGVLLSEQAAALKAAGLQRVNVSLDTLRPGRFRELTRQDLHARVLAGIEAALRAGLTPLKLDTVVLRGINDDELVPLVEFARAAGAEIRFIEYMDVGGATRWSLSQVVTREEILRRLREHFGSIETVPAAAAAPAERYRLPDGTTFGIIASVTSPFCRHCDRSRLTADGVWYLCLYALDGHDLRQLLRSSASDEIILDWMRQIWAERADRGAEVRRQHRIRGPLVSIESLRRDPHLEMHTRGG
jgi:cyclic pyranopterin phosphate synthase